MAASTTYSVDTSVLYGQAPGLNEDKSNIIGLELEIASIQDLEIRKQMRELLLHGRLPDGLPSQIVPRNVQASLVHFDTVNRNTTLYPNIYNCRVNFKYTFKEVYAVRLIRIQIKSSGSVFDMPNNFFVYLRIKNLPSNVVGTNVGANNCFCAIPLLANGTWYSFIDMNYEMSAFYTTPIDRLSHFDLEVRDKTGAFYVVPVDYELLFQIYHMSKSAIQ